MLRAPQEQHNTPLHTLVQKEGKRRDKEAPLKEQDKARHIFRDVGTQWRCRFPLSMSTWSHRRADLDRDSYVNATVC